VGQPASYGMGALCRGMKRLPLIGRAARSIVVPDEKTGRGGWRSPAIALMVGDIAFPAAGAALIPLV
jgi:hypothetical protein